MSISGIAKRCLEPLLQMKIIKVTNLTNNLLISKKNMLLLTKRSKVVLIRINQSCMLGLPVPAKCLSALPLSNILNKDASEVKYRNFDESIKIPNRLLKGILYATAKDDKGGQVRQSGGRLGRFDAANEAGMFHKLSRARLEELKKKLIEMREAIKNEDASSKETRKP